MKHLRKAQTGLLFIIACLGGTLCAAEEITASLEEQIKAASKELEALKDAKDAPQAYKEYRELEMKIAEISQHRAKELSQYQERKYELVSDKDVREWLDKISKAQDSLREHRMGYVRGLHESGREIFTRRQKELASIAAVKTPLARALGFNVLNYPTVDGSTSAKPLGMIIACKVLGNDYKWVEGAPYQGEMHRRIGSGYRFEMRGLSHIEDGPMGTPPYSPMISLIGYHPLAHFSTPPTTSSRRQTVMINRELNNHAGTHGAYVNVIKGNSDIGLVARKPSPDELELAKTEGVELDVVPIALDAFVFIKNHRNPIESLTTEQIRGIYSGKYQDWTELGGPDQRINAYRRNRNSGSQELMEALVMKGLAFEELEHGETKDLIDYGMEGPYIILTYDHWGLAYSVYYFEHFMSGSPNTRLIGVDGVLPSFETIQSGKYPYATKVYAVLRSGLGPDSGAIKLRDWLLSSEGQAVVRESGYVPLR